MNKLKPQDEIGMLHARVASLEQLLKVQERSVIRQAKQLDKLIAELRSASESEEQANRAKSDFLANMSHELRTPLNAIIGYSEMIMEDAEDEGLFDIARDQGKVLSAGRHLLGLINDILDLSKIEAGKVELFLEDFEICTIISEVENTIQPMVEKNDNKLLIECPENAGQMYGDITKLRQILFNLLSNACKFTQKGTITLKICRQIEEDRHWLQFEVGDTGIGMNSQQLENLFRPFAQADASTTRQYGGTGLGMTISQEFCRMMGGKISVKTEEGVGSVFQVRLPAVFVEKPAVDKQKESPASMPEKLLSRSGEKEFATVLAENPILVIDDESDVRELISRFLTKEGFQVVTASTGEEGLKLAREIHPIGITLDVLMPEMDGWAVLTRLKADPELADIPVTMLTMVEDKNMAFALGACEYLIKPIDRKRLIASVRKYCLPESGDHVLVIEDEVDTRSMIVKLLKKNGWGVMEAVNGLEAIEKVKTKIPSVILLDLMMPVMDGFEFVMKLREESSWQKIPIIVITAKTLSPEDQKQLKGNVSKILQKCHYTMGELMQEVARQVRMSAHSEKSQ